jgi:hypothetical protein
VPHPVDEQRHHAVAVGDPLLGRGQARRGDGVQQLGGPTSVRISPPGTDVGAPDQSAHVPPALRSPGLRRRLRGERAAA